MSSRVWRGGKGGLLPLPREVRTRLLAGLGCQFAGAVAGAAPLVAVAELARGFAGDPPGADRAWSLVALATAGVLLQVCLTAAATTLTHLGDTALQLRLRRDLAAHLGRVPLGWFGARNAAVVKRGVADDVGALHHLIAHALPNLVNAVVRPVVSAGYLLFVDWRLALVVLIPLALGRLAQRRAMRDVAARMGEYLAATRELDARALEFVQGAAVVKVFGGEGRARQRFHSASERYAAFLTGWSNGVTPWMAVSQILYSPVAVLLVTATGGSLLVWSGLLTFAGLAPFLVVAPGLCAPALTIGYGMQDVAEGKAAAGRIRELLATPELPRPRTGAAPPAGRADVEFDDVWFGYDGDEGRQVLRGVSLRLAPGTLTALVGPSGAGKSTLATLLARFADVTSGAVRIAGTDIRDLTADTLYRTVGFIFQDVRLLSTSVLENIRLGRPDAPLADVRAAARAAHIHSRVERLPRGYDSVVGEDANLSAGEAQRISIARALLADAPVLVLDEATAFADPESEADIQDALSVLAAGRTVLVVAHRLASVTGADEIVVLDEGRVVQRGRHEELLARPGRYAGLWHAQGGGPGAGRAGEGGRVGGPRASVARGGEQR
ncbi:ABC transporter ATP-binding protein [Streptomyces sp. NPDC049881]|uniref:ABC transporter ATP-binding protein n=1 Tax=Streptomyces sp. NPDC049881 TaxID=3155778 RepID=UPI00342AD512